jgi:protein-tyrosine phosphatase
MANWFVRVWGILLYLLGWKKYAARYFVSQTMNQVGLRGLYFNFVDNCQGGIRDALRIIADNNNHPVLVHCTQGKDRTGLVVALTLHIVGVPMEVILGDYRVSKEGLTWEIPAMLKEMEEVGLNPEFLDSPPETLRDTLGYITGRYSSIDGFLDHIGVGDEERKRMRDGLLDITQSAVSL